MDRKTATEHHKELTSQGWVRRFTAEEPRLSEMRDEYISLGLEVLIVPGAIGGEAECGACFNVPGTEDIYKTLYTRGDARSDRNDDLF
jgi:hypothetical protein